MDAPGKVHAVKVTNAHTESAVEWALLCPISSPTASLAKVDVFNFFIGAKIERSVADTRAHASHFSHPMSAPPREREETPHAEFPPAFRENVAGVSRRVAVGVVGQLEGCLHELVKERVAPLPASRHAHPC